MSHKDPITGEQVRTFYTIEAKTEKQAQRKRDELILELERKGAFRLFKQALKWAQAQDVLTKNPCDYRKPPKRVKTPINALSRSDRTRMLHKG